MGGKIQPFYLSEEEIDYELRNGDSKASSETITSKIIMLGRLFGQETVTTKLLHREFDVEGEKASVDKTLEIVYVHTAPKSFNKTLEHLESSILNLRGPSSDPLNKIIETILTYSTGGVKRFIIPAKPEEKQISLIDVEDNAKTSCIEPDAKLAMNIIPEVVQNSSSMPSSGVGKTVPIH
ncbi:hypothetical protein JTB14_022029 [Gonioctena quinquepunctata]|nr:hypothetical protein JTB14_022029 [Gonioctena quinquepunctata]